MQAHTTDATRNAHPAKATLRLWIQQHNNHNSKIVSKFQQIIAQLYYVQREFQDYLYCNKSQIEHPTFLGSDIIKKINQDLEKVSLAIRLNGATPELRENLTNLLKKREWLEERAECFKTFMKCLDVDFKDINLGKLKELNKQILSQNKALILYHLQSGNASDTVRKFGEATKTIKQCLSLLEKRDNLNNNLLSIATRTIPLLDSSDCMMITACFYSSKELISQTAAESLVKSLNQKQGVLTKFYHEFLKFEQHWNTFLTQGALTLLKGFKPIISDQSMTYQSMRKPSVVVFTQPTISKYYDGQEYLDFGIHNQHLTLQPMLGFCPDEGQIVYIELKQLSSGRVVSTNKRPTIPTMQPNQYMIMYKQGNKIVYDSYKPKKPIDRHNLTFVEAVLQQRNMMTSPVVPSYNETEMKENYGHYANTLKPVRAITFSGNASSQKKHPPSNHQTQKVKKHKGNKRSRSKHHKRQNFWSRRQQQNKLHAKSNKSHNGMKGVKVSRLHPLVL